ncbi:MAG: endonuclease [Flavobacteriaceae bacterium]|nr:endonuclease [Flavobacteriaceae bacterium]
MKFTIPTLLIAMLFLIGCEDVSSDLEKPTSTSSNRQPADFLVSVNRISDTQSTINWTNAIDPDDDTVTYLIEIEGRTIDTIDANTYTFTNLEEGTNYQGDIVAVDGKGGRVAIHYSFKTTEPLAGCRGNNSMPNNLLAYYRSVNFGKIGNSLFNDLATLTISKHSNFLGYSERHNYLYKADADPKNKSNVLLLYSGKSVYWKQYMGNGNYMPQTFNTEHVYPKTYLAKSNSKADLHHLRACNGYVNNKRAALPFTEGSGSYGKKYNGWYPGDEWRGDVARMVLYVHLRYDEPLNGDISTGGINLLLKWNAADPVSAIEIQRNNEIYNAQGNRNPFIDNPYLATRIFGGPRAQNRWN